MRIGVVALQGAFEEHRILLEPLGVEVKKIRLPEDLFGCHGLILPGGETTAQRRLAVNYGLWKPIKEMARAGTPILGTCAGLILMARRIDGREGISLDVMDLDVQRNAYGRQIFSFETNLSVPPLENEFGGSPLFRAIFIRAPRIVRVGATVGVLASSQGEPVALQEGNLIGLCFHPELTRDDRFHRYFLNLAERASQPWSQPHLMI